MPRAKTKPKDPIATPNYTCTGCALDFPKPPRGSILGIHLQMFCDDCWAELERDEQSDDSDDPTSVLYQADVLNTLDELPDDPEEPEPDYPAPHPVIADHDGHIPLCWGCEDPIDPLLHFYEVPSDDGDSLYICADCADDHEAANELVSIADEDDTLITHDPDSDTLPAIAPEDDAAEIPPANLIAALRFDDLHAHGRKAADVAQSLIKLHFGLDSTYSTSIISTINTVSYYLFAANIRQRTVTKELKATVPALADATHAILDQMTAANTLKYGSPFPDDKLILTLDHLSTLGLTHQPHGVRLTIRQWIDKRPNTKKPVTDKQLDDWTTLLITSTFNDTPHPISHGQYFGQRHAISVIPARPAREVTELTWVWWNGKDAKKEVQSYEKDRYLYCQRETVTTIPAEPSKRIQRYLIQTPAGPLHTEVTEEA